MSKNKLQPDAAKKETFFPGVRKPVRIDDVRPLESGAGEKRIKLDCIISLSDNQVTGIPEWLEDGIKLCRKGDGGWGVNKNLAELDGVMLRFYAAFGDEYPALELSGVLMKGFVVRRSGTAKPAGDLADSELFFQVYTWFDQKTWRWAGEAFTRTIWTGFGTLQARISFGPAESEKKTGKPEPAAPLFDTTSPEQQPGESLEEARKRATSQAFDALFDPHAVAEVEGDEVDPHAGITDDTPEDDAITDDDDMDIEHKIMRSGAAAPDTRQLAGDPVGPRLVSAAPAKAVTRSAAKKTPRKRVRHVN